MVDCGKWPNLSTTGGNSTLKVTSRTISDVVLHVYTGSLYERSGLIAVISDFFRGNHSLSGLLYEVLMSYCYIRNDGQCIQASVSVT